MPDERPSRQSRPRGITLPFDLPSPDGSGAKPIWTGRGFRLGDETHPVLCYDVGKSAWTDELTQFHEAEAGENHPIDVASRRHSIAQLKRWVVAPEPVIMDIGCSSGYFLQLLRNDLAHAPLIGADYVPGPLHKLAVTLPELPLLQFDLVRCQLPSSILDAVVLLNVLEHIEDDQGAMAQTFRILKPGGVAVIEVPAGPHLYDVYDKQLLHYRRYRMKELLSQLRMAGFEILASSHLGVFVYPAFSLVKRRNQRHLQRSAAEQKAIVAANIRSSGNSFLMTSLMNIESALRRFVPYPSGIRCVVTCRKPT